MTNETQTPTNTKATTPHTTRVIPIEKLGYEKMITLKRHIVDVKESAQGIVTVSIIPLSDNMMDSTVIRHDPDEDIVRVSTSRDIRVIAKSVTKIGKV